MGSDLKFNSANGMNIGLVFPNLGIPKTQEAKSGHIKTDHRRLGNWGFAPSHLMHA